MLPNSARSTHMLIVLFLGWLLAPQTSASAQPVEPCLAFSPYVDGFSPIAGPHPTPMAIDVLLDAVVTKTAFRCIQTYGVLNGLDHTITAAMPAASRSSRFYGWTTTRR